MVNDRLVDVVSLPRSMAKEALSVLIYLQWARSVRRRLNESGDLFLGISGATSPQGRDTIGGLRATAASVLGDP